jgi:glycosyltransferase involved in cell wall biosynthesis
MTSTKFKQKESLYKQNSGISSTACQQKLKILMVAPQPFFSARGTPFSVLHRIRALTEVGHSVDLITYPFGENIEMDNLKIIRCSSIPFINKIKIGPSIPKLLLDIPLFFSTLKALRNNKYDLIHSHEEAAFFCVQLAKANSLIHIYDMHSSLPQQLSNFKAFNIGFLRSVFERLERYVLESCDGVITICDDLARVVKEKDVQKPHKMIENIGEDSKFFKPIYEDLISDLFLQEKQVLLYTGTFEAYQGIDLLLEAMTEVNRQVKNVVLVLAGGAPNQVDYYKAMSARLGITDSVRFVGTVHPSRIPNFFNIADVIVSPRSRGTNTPLKIYGYMRTEVPLVATDRHTHTQILNKNMAELVPADREGLANGICKVLKDKNYAETIAAQAKKFADDNFSDEKYIQMVHSLYNDVLNARKLA